MYNNYRLIRQARRERRARRRRWPGAIPRLAPGGFAGRLPAAPRFRIGSLPRSLPATALALLGLAALLLLLFAVSGSDLKVVPLLTGAAVPLQPAVWQQAIGREELAGLLPADYFALDPPRPVLEGADASTVFTTIDPACQEAFFKYFNRYEPQIGAGVLLDLKNGAVLAMAEYRHPDEGGAIVPLGSGPLVLQPLFPAASLFKIVTAYGVLEKEKIDRKATYPLVGRYHTLYKYQLGLGNSRYRYRAKAISFEEAFARSVNPVFGKLGIEVFSPEELLGLGDKFLFNQPLAFDLPLAASALEEPQTPFRQAELASGFIKSTLVSPLHAALIAGAPAAGGEVFQPLLVRRVVAADGAELYYRPQPGVMFRLEDAHACTELAAMMRATVRYGTASKAFRHLKRRKIYRQLEIGGKTGSLDMPNVDRRCEWFAGFCAAPDDCLLAVAVVLVHGEKRSISAAYIASEMLAQGVSRE